MKDTLIEVKNILQGNNSRVDEAKNQINDLKYRKQKATNQNNKKKKESPKHEDSLSSLWDNFKRFNILIIGVSEEEKEQETGNLVEIMKENFLNLVKEVDMQVQEAQRVPNKMDAKRPTHKMPKGKDKERILKAAREKQSVTYRGIPI